MLLSFSVFNYRSIKDEITLSFLPLKSHKDLLSNIAEIGDKAKVLRSAIIYGANASGKSNVLKALTGFIELIQNSSTYKLNEKIKLHDPFLLDNESNKHLSGFKLEFLFEQVRYVYDVSCNSNSIKTEKLYYYPKGQKVRIFERTSTDKFHYGTVIKGEKRSIENRLLENQLYLSKAANENIAILSNLYKWFGKIETSFSILSGLSEVVDTSTIIGSALKNKDEKFFNRFEKIILAFDVGIDSLKINKNTREKNLFSLLPDEATELLNAEPFETEIPELDSELFIVHKFKSPDTDKPEYREFPLDRESSGTKNLLSIAFKLLEHFEMGTTMIIDEFERSLHPHIVEKLIRLFHDSEINVNNAQLICSTHAVSLLSNELFRRDQIWFTEKDERSATQLFSLSQIEGVRKDIPYDKWYLSGRFGATPIVYESDIDFGDEI